MEAIKVFLTFAIIWILSLGLGYLFGVLITFDFCWPRELSDNVRGGLAFVFFPLSLIPAIALTIEYN